MRSLARRARGATDAINSSQVDLHATLQSLTDSHGPNIIVEAVGSPATFRLAVEEVAFAGRVVYIGYAKAPVEYDSKQFVLKELDILGSRNALPEDFARVAAMLVRKQFPVDQVVTPNGRLRWRGGRLSAVERRSGRGDEDSARSWRRLMTRSNTSAGADDRFFDLQVNGYAGVDFNGDQLSAEELRVACEALRARWR